MKSDSIIKECGTIHDKICLFSGYISVRIENQSLREPLTNTVDADFFDENSSSQNGL